ncbi:tRNA uridine-5-carboxymethylaminomethyl(34) synthesis GTPase MnmE [Temperatibacter marinus]|uniref:tRNA modification GTPase MnmE n=1 Tax=Temperatibacter marinus TaxID=1456591 RepID=A0AA52EHC4_9PROT|nr:tRNA uridine-5-carboxymethylaminomethyl(34) synthesis GTPase MnmE [Temperatibacter marinus]WND03673.1 tRNA uridine-5-carboxymethylaminomethyl(34) synthesis GTPase MnmE [Temperatibacter marinus]
MTAQKTIYALSSGAGTAGVAVIRLSGPDSFEALTTLTGRHDFEPRVATLCKLKDPDDRSHLDHALALPFKEPYSFTGEDVVELHIHGGRAVTEGVLSTLHKNKSLRMAEPGEFTRRAFENGKMDLTEAEGLNDLIHAQTAAQRQLALRQMDGALRHLYEGWRRDLVSLLAHLEADIDFPDEDLPEGVAEAARPKIRTLCSDLKGHLDDNNKGQALRNGFTIVILGAPNAGKSSLMNALAQSDVAIVSDEAGTTRDAIEVNLDLGGYPVRFIDTAGIRENAGKVESEGIKRALNKAEQAHLKLITIRADEWPDVSRETLELIDDRSFVVFSQSDKADLDPAMFHVKHPSLRPVEVTTTSSVTQQGISDLLEKVERYSVAQMEINEAPILTRMRHRTALEECISHLERFDQSATLDAVLAAEDVRMAARCLGSITGLIDVEELLDVIFSDFCIGK